MYTPHERTDKTGTRTGYATTYYPASHFRPATILIVLAVARLATASPQTAADRPQPVGSGRLTGRVIASDNGAPVKHADIRLSGSAESRTNSGAPRTVERSSETDANGVFDFANLPAGSYSMTVNPVSGFVPPSRPRSAALSEGQTLQITFRLGRAGAIEGRVVDENGDGLFLVEVHPVRRINIAGYIKIAPSGPSAMTDDRGRFRIFNVPPGEYYVVATYRPPRLDINPIPRAGYANTYHPNSLTTDGARSIVVRPGRTTERVDVTLTTRQLVRLSVRAVNAQNVPLGKEAQLSLHKRDPFYSETSLRFPGLPKDGTFVFDDIMPGQYALVVATSSRLEEAAYVDVTVADKDLSLNVQTNTGARVSGRVLVDGVPLTGVEGVGFVSVWAHRSWQHLGMSYAEVPRAEVRGTDRFELRGLRGPMVIEADSGVGTLVSIKRAGRIIAGNALDLIGTETIDDVVIEFTRQIARLEVAVTGTGAVDPEPVFLVLFSDDPSLWAQGHVEYTRATVPPKSGERRADSRITLPSMVPGRYRVIAIPDPEISFPEDTAILEKLRPLATLVTLVDGQTVKINIGVAKFGR
jgi:carboxypeptidase family protein